MKSDPVVRTFLTFNSFIPVEFKVRLEKAITMGPFSMWQCVYGCGPSTSLHLLPSYYK